MAQNVRPGRFDARHHQPVNPPLDDPSCERSRVEDNDLLVTIVGANTGDVCRVPEPLNEYYVCQSVALMRPIEKRTAKYLDCYYNAQNGGQRHYRRYIYGAGRPHLSFDQLKMTPVAIPPIEEQDAIVDAIEDQLSTVEHLESDLDTKLTNAQALRQSILRHAFSGKLVPQDPNDEPASNLLKRIAAEREQRAREAAAAKKLNGHTPRRAGKPRGKTPRAKARRQKETGHGRIADR
jgi:type I restriction enzyme S subunit